MSPTADWSALGAKSRKFRRNLALTEMRIVRSLRAQQVSWSSNPWTNTWGSASCPLNCIVMRATRQLHDWNYERPGFSMARMLSKLDMFLAAHCQSIDFTEGKWLRYQPDTSQFRLA